jgi:CubicO group peptidase (beta-lactamase class C family)
VAVSFKAAADVVRRGLDERAYPAAVVEVGSADELLWRDSVGRLDYEPDSPPAGEETIFDLASLTKVVSTSTLMMQMIDARRLTLDDRVGRWIAQWRGADRETVTIRSMLAHSSGLTAWLPFYRDYIGRSDFQHAICSLPLEYAPDTQSIYSDLGFMLLGFILEDAGGATLETLWNRAVSSITSLPLRFNPPVSLRARIAPTERDPWRGRLLVGEVHDENCWALGGAAGHAGLFGTAPAVGEFSRAMLASLQGRSGSLASRDIATTFVTRASTPGSRALAWDTMLPTSSCGTKMSPTSFGHTGFTGTSLWIDPVRQIYVVFLTNRVHPTRDNTAIQQIRPALHDAVMEGLG